MKYKISETFKKSIKDFEKEINYFQKPQTQEEFDEKFLDRLFISLVVRSQQKRLKEIKNVNV